MPRDFLERHKVLGRLAVIWAICLITAVVIRYLFKMGEVGAPDATIISVGVVGLFGSTVALLKWYMERDKP